MIIIGERINTSREPVERAVANRDAAYIKEDVQAQEAAGAAYIDVNAGARIGHEDEDMAWLVGVIQDAVDLPLSLDSPDPSVLERAYALVDKPPLMNSISLETERYEAMMPVLRDKECEVIALCMDDTGMPKDADGILDRARRLIAGLQEAGFAEDRIHVDPLIQPISTDQTNGLIVLEAVRRIREESPDVHFTCGLSNVSYGLPERQVVNRSFLALLMGAGLDGAIVDPLDEKLMATAKTVDMLLGRDEFCGAYLDGVRAGQIFS